MGEPIDPIRALTKRLNVEDGFRMKIAACSGYDSSAQYSAAPDLSTPEMVTPAGLLTVVGFRSGGSAVAA
jgi:hypothetical protein